MPRAALHDLTLSYTTFGTWSPGHMPLVLVHGLAASSAFWFHAAEALATSHPILIFDLRGHGRSTQTDGGYTPVQLSDDLIALLDHLQLDRVLLAGHSYGGSIALHAALRHPGRFARVAVADTRLRVFQRELTPAAWPKWPERKEHLRALGFHFDENEPEGGVRLLTEMARAEINAGNGIELPKWVHEFFGLRQSRFTAARWLELVEKTSLLDDIRREDLLDREALAAIAAPVLGVYGENSPLLPSGRMLEETRPATILRIAEGAGHFFPAVRARQFVEPLLEFLA